MSNGEVKQDSYLWPCNTEDQQFGSDPIPPVGVPEKWDMEADHVVVGAAPGCLDRCAHHGASLSW